jgi:hypothetical protein
MGVEHNKFRAAKPGLPVMWGSAAWAQTQLTPGVSVLAAPRSSIRPTSPCCVAGNARRATTSIATDLFVKGANNTWQRIDNRVRIWQRL